MDEKNENRGVVRGRKPGVPNRTTKESRKAIALFVEQNLPRLDMWLNQVANGLPKVDAEGEPVRDTVGSVVFVVRPDPAGAMKALSDIMEYHLPKLSRQDVQLTGMVAHVDGSEWTQEELQKLPLSELKRMALEHYSQRGDTIDVTPTEVLPDWLKPDENASDVGSE